MKPNNAAGAAGSNHMMISEVKSLKERIKVLETDNKLLRSREVAQNAPVVSTQEHNKVRNLLLNLLVAVENKLPDAKGELKTAVDAAGAFIRPSTPSPGIVSKAVVLTVNRAE